METGWLETPDIECNLSGKRILKCMIIRVFRSLDTGSQYSDIHWTNVNPKFILLQRVLMTSDVTQRS